jgi:hypothetical protein
MVILILFLPKYYPILQRTHFCKMETYGSKTNKLDNNSRIGDNSVLPFDMETDDEI